MSVGGTTWETAGTLELGSGNTFDPDDAIQSVLFTDEAWWTFTVTASASVTLSVGPDTNFALYSGDDYASKVSVESQGFEGDFDAGFSAFYLLTPATYHLAAGSVGSPTLYQITYAARPLISSPWISTLRDVEENYVTLNTRDLSGILAPTSTRVAEYVIEREIDSPDLDGLECAWRHARNGDSDVIIWGGICPALPAGVVDGGLIRFSPSWSSTYGPTHGGDAEESIAGAALFVAKLYEILTPYGSLAVPDPVEEGYPVDALIEWEQPKPDIRLIEYGGDDTPPGPGVAPAQATIEFRDEHVIPAPLRIVPQGFDPNTGHYDQWPLGGHSGPYALEDTPHWEPLIEEPSWDYFFFPEGDTYTAADFVFSASLLHTAPDNGSGTRPNFMFTARFTLAASRYRWVYEGPTSIPPRRIFGRSDGATHGARRTLGGGNTRQSGSRTLGSIL